MDLTISRRNRLLTFAEYGVGSTLSTHKDRYTERFNEFMLNGGIHRLQRHGLKAEGNYGKIDNLHISYNGNRITTVLEDADPVTQSGSMDYPGAKREIIGFVTVVMQLILLAKQADLGRIEDSRSRHGADIVGGWKPPLHTDFEELEECISNDS